MICFSLAQEQVADSIGMAGVEPAGDGDDGGICLADEDSVTRPVHALRYPAPLMRELRARIACRGEGETAREGRERYTSEGEPDGKQEEAEPRVAGLALAIRTAAPGDARKMFLRNIHKIGYSTLCEGVSAVRRARLTLGGPDEQEGGQLQVGSVLEGGTFGTVSRARHAVLPGEFAFKTLKEVRLLPVLYNSWSMRARGEGVGG